MKKRPKKATPKPYDPDAPEDVARAFADIVAEVKAAGPSDLQAKAVARPSRARIRRERLHAYLEALENALGLHRVLRQPLDTESAKRTLSIVRLLLAIAPARRAWEALTPQDQEGFQEWVQGLFARSPGPVPGIDEKRLRAHQEIRAEHPDLPASEVSRRVVERTGVWVAPDSAERSIRRARNRARSKR